MTKKAVGSVYLNWLTAAIANERGASSLNAAIEKTLILGYATGYDVADVAVFVRSLRAYYSGPCALVVDADPVLQAFLAEYGIEALDAPELCRDVSEWQPHPVVTRFAGFEALLKQRPWVQHAFLTDVRDVVFQADPFDPLPGSLEVFAECDGPLQDHDFNMKYLRAVAGDSLASALGDKPCLCVGTVIGDRLSLMRFCRLTLLLGAIPRSEIGGAFGTDQATANIAVHLDLIQAEICANFGRVSTLGMIPGDEVWMDGNQIVNPNGSVSPIVHQHDRHPHLLDPVQAMWAQGIERRSRSKSPMTLSGHSQKLAGSIRKRLPELR